MDYYFTYDQKKIDEAVQTLAENEFPKVSREYDREEKFHREIWKQAGKIVLWLHLAVAQIALDRSVTYQCISATVA